MDFNSIAYQDQGLSGVFSWAKGIVKKAPGASWAIGLAKNAPATKYLKKVPIVKAIKEHRLKEFKALGVVREMNKTLASLNPNHPLVKKIKEKRDKAQKAANTSKQLALKEEKKYIEIENEPVATTESQSAYYQRTYQPASVQGLGSLWSKFTSEGWKPTFYKILDASKKSKALYHQKKQYAKGIEQMEISIADTDKLIAEMQQQMTAYGLSGLGAWYTPPEMQKSNAESALKKKRKTFQEMEVELNKKLDLVEAMQAKIEAYETQQGIYRSTVTTPAPGTAIAPGSTPGAAAPEAPQPVQAGGIALAALGVLVVGGYLLYNKKK